MEAGTNEETYDANQKTIIQLAALWRGADLPLSATGIGHGRTGAAALPQKKAACASTTRIIPLGAVIPRVRPAAMSVRYAIRKITENQEL